MAAEDNITIRLEAIDGRYIDGKETYQCLVPRSFTIRKFIKQLIKYTDVHLDSIPILLLGNNELDDDHTFAAYGIKDDELLHVRFDVKVDIEDENGDIIEVITNPDFTVQNLKDQIRRESNGDIQQNQRIELKSVDRIMEDGSPLTRYGVVMGDTFTMTILPELDQVADQNMASEDKIQIHLESVTKKYLNGYEKFPCRVSRSDTIEEFKDWVDKNVRLPICILVLLLGNDELDDDRTFADYGIEDGTLLHVRFDIMVHLVDEKQVKIKDISPVVVNPLFTVKTLKDKIRRKCKQQNQRIELKRDGQRMEDGSLLCAYHVRMDDRITTTFVPEAAAGNAEHDQVAAESNEEGD